MRWVKSLTAAAAALVLLLLAAHQAVALDINITLKPEPPPGLGEKVGMFLRWLYYLAIAACIGGAMVGVAMLLTGKDTGRYVLVIALVALAVLASLPMIIKAI